MFYTVFVTFFKFLLWYSFFVIAFALSFYVMFHTDHKNGTKNDDYPFFDEIGTSLLKAAAMFVGELEFSDIPFTENAISKILFVAFIFLIVVVLMNLLNGLAVSDTGIIMEKAEIVSFTTRVETISYMESVLLGDPFQFLSRWPAVRFLSRVPSLALCHQVYTSCPSARRAGHCITGATGILLFYR